MAVASERRRLSHDEISLPNFDQAAFHARLGNLTRVPDDFISSDIGYIVNGSFNVSTILFVSLAAEAAGVDGARELDLSLVSERLSALSTDDLQGLLGDDQVTAGYFIDRLDVRVDTHQIDSPPPPKEPSPPSPPPIAPLNSATSSNLESSQAGSAEPTSSNGTLVGLFVTTLLLPAALVFLLYRRQQRLVRVAEKAKSGVASPGSEGKAHKSRSHLELRRRRPQHGGIQHLDGIQQLGHSPERLPAGATVPANAAGGEPEEAGEADVAEVQFDDAEEPPSPEKPLRSPVGIPEAAGHVDILASAQCTPPPPKRKHRSHFEIRRTPLKRTPTNLGAHHVADISWTDIPTSTVPCVLQSDSSYRLAEGDRSPTGSDPVSSSPVESEAGDAYATAPAFAPAAASPVVSSRPGGDEGLSAAARIQRRRTEKEAEARRRMGFEETPKRKDFEGADIVGVSPAYLATLERVNATSPRGSRAATLEPLAERSTPDQAKARSEAAVARARARARMEASSGAGPGSRIAADKQAETQQDWLASALGAVAAEEDRAGAPVNVQLDWLSVAILNQTSFSESSNGQPSPPSTRPPSVATTPRPVIATPRAAARSVKNLFTKNIQL